MRVVVDLVARITIAGAMALASWGALAQGDLPPLALGLSPEGVRALNDQFEEDVRILDAFGRKTNMDRFKDGGYVRAVPWTVYGRLGVLNFQDTLDPSRSAGGSISFRRTGPKLTGRYYIGIHRTF